MDQRRLGNTRGWQVHEHAVVAPRVTVPAVLIGSEYWIISGEQRPGVRSPEVWRVGVEGD
jgi:N-acetylneuraminic acid mutarotase